MDDEQQQVVVMTATGVVLRAGFSDFATDGTFDPGTETILVQGLDFDGRAIFDPPPPEIVWIWNGSTFERAT
jgi:hypothetical protein